MMFKKITEKELMEISPSYKNAQIIEENPKEKYVKEYLKDKEKKNNNKNK